MFRHFYFILFLCTIGAIAVEANGMSLLKGEKYCVASAFEGRITFEGKPASGARIVRKFNWKDEKGETEEIIADQDGRFSFPSHWSVVRKLMTEFVAHQSLFVHYKDQEYQVWGTAKRETNEYEEFGGKPENFRCELTDEIRRVDLERGFIGTNCYWDHAE